MTTELTLPGGWAWAANPHDLRKGIAVAKVWWHNDVPFIRCQVGTEVDRSGNRRTFGWLSYAEAQRAPYPSPRRMGKQDPPFSRDRWKWVFIMEVPDLPPDPLAAAMSVEMDFGQIKATVLDSGKRVLGSSVSTRPLWLVESDDG